jgi:hypothetical protein
VPDDPPLGWVVGSVAVPGGVGRVRGKLPLPGVVPPPPLPFPVLPLAGAVVGGVAVAGGRLAICGAPVLDELLPSVA